MPQVGPSPAHIIKGFDLFTQQITNSTGQGQKHTSHFKVSLAELQQEHVGLAQASVHLMPFKIPGRDME